MNSYRNIIDAQTITEYAMRAYVRHAPYVMAFYTPYVMAHAYVRHL